ncbi:hypothetical protein Tco_1568675 [Tanacetum coccineum]
MLNPNPDTGIDSVLNVETTSLVDVPVTSQATTTLPQPSNPLIPPVQQTPTPTLATTPSSSLLNLPNFGSLFGFDDRLKRLEADFSEFKQTNQYATTLSSIPNIVDNYLGSKLKESVDVAVQLKSDRLREEAQTENESFLNNLDATMQKIIKEQVNTRVKKEVSKILLRIEKLVNEQLESEILIDKMESNKSIDRSDQQKKLYKALVDVYAADKDLLDAYGDTGSKRRRAEKEPESSIAPKETTSKSTDKSTEGSKSRHQSAGQSALAEEPIHIEDDFEEPTHQDFKTGVNDDQPEDEIHPYPDWFQKPTRLPYPDSDWNKTLPADHGPVQPWLSNLARQEDPRESFDELMDTPLDFPAFMMNRLKLDWTNPDGQQYPHDLRKPLPLISNTRGRQVIPFDHFINNDLAYLSGGVSSQKEFAKDVYSRRRIIAVTKLQIIEWHGYKHLDWITVRRDGDKLYLFKEGDLKRLRLQDIEDMMILLVQGKLSNLKIEERLAFSVALRMFTRSFVIQRRVKDFQLGVESYQKKLNITKLDTFRSDLRRQEQYTAYSSPRGFIYQNKDKNNRLMHLDELHKFSDGTLDDVRTALDDRLKGIRMEYLPNTIWRQSDKERVTAMIQTIDKRLKSRRIMRSLERFVGGRPYEGDLQLLQRTI